MTSFQCIQFFRLVLNSIFLFYFIKHLTSGGWLMTTKNVSIILNDQHPWGDAISLIRIFFSFWKGENLTVPITVRWNAFSLIGLILIFCLTVSGLLTWSSIHPSIYRRSRQWNCFEEFSIQRTRRSDLKGESHALIRWFIYFVQ